MKTDLLWKITFCLTVNLVFHGCSLSEPSQSPPKYKNSFIAAEAEAANEMIKKGMIFNYRSTADGITREGGSNWFQEFYSSDGVKIIEKFADYKSPDNARREFYTIVEKLKDAEIFEEGESLVITAEKSNSPSARIVSLEETSVYEVQAPTLRYAFAFKNRKLKN